MRRRWSLVRGYISTYAIIAFLILPITIYGAVPSFSSNQNDNDLVFDEISQDLNAVDVPNRNASKLSSHTNKIDDESADETTLSRTTTDDIDDNSDLSLTARVLRRIKRSFSDILLNGNPSGQQDKETFPLPLELAAEKTTKASSSSGYTTKDDDDNDDGDDGDGETDEDNKDTTDFEHSDANEIPSTTIPSTGETECTANEFLCDANRCLHSSVRCNRLAECADGTDEHNCPPVECTDGQLKCSNSSCIDLDKRCDGRSDCPGGEDEQNCPCKKSEFECGTGICVPSKEICDGIRHSQH